MGPKSPVLRRYTDLPSAIQILRSKRLTLLDPATWEDKADARFMSRYKEQRSASCLVALCFSMASETFHHWRVFSHGAGGICITFRTSSLLESFGGVAGLSHREVSYRKLAELGRSQAAIADLPFVKRHAYRDEKEYRIIYESQKRAQQPIPFKITIASIERITVSPWLDKIRFAALRTTLRQLPGCSRLKVARSSLMDNERWSKFGLGAA